MAWKQQTDKDLRPETSPRARDRGRSRVTIRTSSVGGSAVAVGAVAISVASKVARQALAQAALDRLQTQATAQAMALHRFRQTAPTGAARVLATRRLRAEKAALVVRADPMDRAETGVGADAAGVVDLAPMAAAVTAEAANLRQAAARAALSNSATSAESHSSFASLTDANQRNIKKGETSPAAAVAADAGFRSAF